MSNTSDATSVWELEDGEQCGWVERLEARDWTIDGEVVRLTPIYGVGTRETSWTVLRAPDGRLFVHESGASEWRLAPAPSWVAGRPSSTTLRTHAALHAWFGTWIPPILGGVDSGEEPEDTDEHYTERSESLDPSVRERVRRQVEAALVKHEIPLTPVWSELRGSGYAWCSGEIGGSCHRLTAPLRGPFGELTLVIDLRRFDDDPWEGVATVASSLVDGVTQDLGLEWCLEL